MKLNQVLLTEEQLLLANDELLLSRIEILTLLLDQVEQLDTRARIDFEIHLYHQFLSKNGTLFALKYSLSFAIGKDSHESLL